MALSFQEYDLPPAEFLPPFPIHLPTAPGSDLSPSASVASAATTTASATTAGPRASAGLSEDLDGSASFLRVGEAEEEEEAARQRDLQRMASIKACLPSHVLVADVAMGEPAQVMWLACSLPYNRLGLVNRGSCH